MTKVKIFISPKQNISDPQGQAVENALKQLGFTDAKNVRIGKYITLEIENSAQKKIKEMCQKLLANPIIEDYQFEIVRNKE